MADEDVAGLEKKAEREFTTIAEMNGWLVRKLIFGDIRGAGDRIYGKHGRTVNLEWKRRGKPATRQQFKRGREAMQSFGWEWYCVDNIEDAKRALGIP